MVNLPQDSSEPTESPDQERLTQIIDQAGERLARSTDHLPKDVVDNLSPAVRDIIEQEHTLHPREQSGTEPGLTEDMRERLLRKRNENDRNSGGRAA